MLELKFLQGADLEGLTPQMVLGLGITQAVFTGMGLPTEVVKGDGNVMIFSLRQAAGLEKGIFSGVDRQLKHLGFEVVLLVDVEFGKVLFLRWLKRADR